MRLLILIAALFCCASAFCQMPSDTSAHEQWVSENARVYSGTAEITSLLVNSTPIVHTKKWKCFEMRDGMRPADDDSLNAYLNMVKRNVPKDKYVYEFDRTWTVTWALVCPDSSGCEVFQRFFDIEVVKPLLFKPGQKVWRNYVGYHSEEVTIASFDDYKSTNATYPVIILGEEPYYLINHRGFWSYQAQSDMSATPRR